MSWKRVVSIGAAFTACLLAGAAFGQSAAQRTAAARLPQLFTKQVAMIPMRDGVRLYTEIYRPRDASGPLPFLMARTPYGVHDDAQGYDRSLLALRAMWPAGYVFVFQDIRGRFRSEGKFVMLRFPCVPMHSGCMDEGTDTNDTISWLIKNVPNNNGKVGIMGVSYGGWLTAMALLHPSPALKAASEQASPADMFIGDDFHHNGAFRLSYAFEYAALMEKTKGMTLFQFPTYDVYPWYLRLGSLSNIDRLYLHGQYPSWEHFIHHPNYDSYWQTKAVWPYFDRLTLTVPNLNVAGWWDQEDGWGPVAIYKAATKHDTHHDNYLVEGPWNHGGWGGPSGASLGPIQFGSPTSQYFQQHIEAPWFAYWLKGEGQRPNKHVQAFETGSNRWRQYETWPPEQNIEHRKLYLRSGGRLAFTPPEASGAGAYDSYVSDPAHPLPYRPRPIEETYGPGSRWRTWLVQDQRFVYLRPGTAAWQTPVLDHDLTVTGDIVAHLWVSTSGTDSDYVAKLIDVYPQHGNKDVHMNGYQLMIADEIMRARFRNSYSHPEAMTPHQPTEITIDLHAADHVFLAGHRIMVQVQSSWFPLYDRNPQTFVPNIFFAKPSDFVKATERVYRSADHASYIALPVQP